MSRIALRTDAIGYRIDNELIDGFPDMPSLTAQQRETVARWARRLTPDALTPEQNSLIAAAPNRSASVAQRELGDNRERLSELAEVGGLWDSLTQDEQRWVIRPFDHPAVSTATDYPLSVSEAAVVIGATERQVRLWVDAGLMHADREGDARRVYSAGVVQGLALVKQEQAEKTVLARVVDGKESSFLDLLADGLLTWSAGKSEAVRMTVTDAARALNAVAKLMISDGQAKIADETVPRPTFSFADGGSHLLQTRLLSAVQAPNPAEAASVVVELLSTLSGTKAVVHRDSLVGALADTAETPSWSILVQAHPGMAGMERSQPDLSVRIVNPSTLQAIDATS